MATARTRSRRAGLTSQRGRPATGALSTASSEMCETIRWFRQVSAQGQFSLGAQRYGLGKTYAGQTIEITFDLHTGCLHSVPERGDSPPPLAIQGLLPHDLTGGWPPWYDLPSYQHRLPFTAQTWRDMILQQPMGGTIL